MADLVQQGLAQHLPSSFTCFPIPSSPPGLRDLHPGPEFTALPPTQALCTCCPHDPELTSSPSPQRFPPHPLDLGASPPPHPGKPSLTFLTRSNPAQAHKSLGIVPWVHQSQGQCWWFRDHLCPPLGCELWARECHLLCSCCSLRMVLTWCRCSVNTSGRKGRRASPAEFALSKESA